MLEIYVTPSRTISIKEAISDAIEAGQYDTLADDIRDCFSEDQIEQIEEYLDSGDIDEAIDGLLSDWSGDSQKELLDELIELFAESNVEIHFDDEVEEDVEDGYDENTYDEGQTYDDDNDDKDEDEDEDAPPDDEEDY